MNKLAALFLFICLTWSAQADPRLSSWFTGDSGKYARIYETKAAESAGTSTTIWSRGQGVQTTPVYAGVSKVEYSANWVYIRTSGLAGHVMGPWYLNAAKTQDFPNFPDNQAKLYRIPRTPVIPTTKTLTGLGATGAMVNGVSMFDSRDAFSYVSASSTDATPINQLAGDGVWNRDGYHNEGVTFDAALAHQAGSNYHYHAHPIGLRYQLGDHVDYNPATNRYTESTQPVTRHSPIVAWAADGLPVYGPYGYASPLDPNSGIRRMTSGFVLRNGNFGTTDLTATGRKTLPAWAQRIQAVTFKDGPNVDGTYLLGHYIEDFDYLGDRGYTQGVDFDLNEQNVRWCYTPEFPTGTWAYFTTIYADGTPAFPYTTGRQYFGSPTGGITTITETVTTFFHGGPSLVEKPSSPSLNPTSGDVTLVWSAVEGGTYLVEASENLVAWPDIATNVNSVGATASFVETAAANTHDRRFYRFTRTALAPFDTAGFDYTAPGGGGGTATSIAPGGSAAAGVTVTVTITLPSTQPYPPTNLVPVSVTLGGTIVGSSVSRPSQTTVLATFAIPTGTSPGLRNIGIVFNPGPTYTLTGSFTIN